MAAQNPRLLKEREERGTAVESGGASLNASRNHFHPRKRSDGTGHMHLCTPAGTRVRARVHADACVRTPACVRACVRASMRARARSRVQKLVQV
eukprot:5919684-Pleurochrysis_carterae.AAC.2